MVTADQLDFFKNNGYLIVRDFLTSSEVEDLQKWTQEVHDWIPEPDSDFMPYEVRLFPSPVAYRSLRVNIGGERSWRTRSL